ncbi:MAG: 23S rRNA (adenine(2503)-C(2))-methyltransferase RlmN [Syntrophomonadaceae bacterium]|jgi:23S rRNA (adenine2503-C2)-methyltransferase
MEDDRKTELLSLDIDELEDFMQSVGQPRYRGRQVFKWIYHKGVSSFYEMSDIPKRFRYELDEIAKISIPRVLKQRVSSDGTRKFLLELEDKKRIETVIIPHNNNDKNTSYTLCISTQVGCPVGCSFCATGASGFQRNLRAFEIVGQYLGSVRELKKKLRKISSDQQLITNVVYMGMGEPLLNYNETIESIRVLNNPRGINLGQRHITISTCGEIPGIKRLAREPLQVTLAISLHASNNHLRSQIIPLNRKYPLEDLMEAVSYYISLTNRRVTFEYVLLDGINTSAEDAQNLVKLVKPLLCNVNLIPYNEVEGLGYKKPSNQTALQFFDQLSEAGINVTFRQEKGADIEAACGQLRLESKGIRGRQ